MTRQRLHKLMAACGVGSRRACEDLITQGRVEVDGRTVTELGTQVDDQTQEVRCDGQLLRPEPQLYYLLNKPRGVICSMSSMPGKPRAVDFLPQRARDRRLFTIGRLDVDSDGALILTNDGELCHLVSHPRFGVHKTYRVEVDGVPDEATIESMRRGVWLSEGRTGAVDVSVVHRFRERTLLAITLQEGKRREIRRICARFGHEVRHLTRMTIGPVELGELRPGEVRSLSPAEIGALRASAQAVIRLGGTPLRTERPPRRAVAAQEPAPRAKRSAPQPHATRKGKPAQGAHGGRAPRERAGRERDARPAASGGARGAERSRRGGTGPRSGPGSRGSGGPRGGTGSRGKSGPRGRKPR